MSFLLGLAVLLALVVVWWGAAVTTKDVGLAVPDWPLCFGKINPQGWTGLPALLLEHGHRWSAAILGVAVLLAFSVEWWKEKRPLLGVGLLTVLFAVLVYLVSKGGSPDTKAPTAYYAGAATLAILLLVWLVREWRSPRGFCMKLGSTAIILVVIQACLGGLRVLHLSDGFAMMHGLLAQVFFCVLWTWFLVASGLAGRGESYARAPESTAGRWMSGLWLAGILLQLMLAVGLRHSQRMFLVSSDVFTTGGTWLPNRDSVALWMMFAHKTWAWSLALGVLILLWLRRKAGRDVALYPVILTGLISIQIGLGVWVLWSGKSFWSTNFHVIHGLLVLAVSMTYAVFAWRRSPVKGLFAGQQSGAGT